MGGGAGNSPANLMIDLRSVKKSKHRDQWVAIRLTKEEKKRLCDAADKVGLKVTQFACRAVFYAVEDVEKGSKEKKRNR